MMNDDERAWLKCELVEHGYSIGFAEVVLESNLNMLVWESGIAYAQKWRSMESEKPERWQFCIVAVDGIVPQAVLIWDGERFVISFSDSEYPFPVTHWMPLPLPPTEAK